MRLHNPFARHVGRHVPRPTARAPFICLNCDEGYHHGSGITWPCECVCVAPLAIEAPHRERPSWRERLAGGVSALIDVTARGMAWLADHGTLEEVVPDDEPDYTECSDPPEESCADAGCPVHGRDDDDEDEDDPAAQVCPHCGRPGFDGGVCGRCGWGYGYQPAHEAAVAAIYAPGQLPVTPRDDDATDIFSLPRVSGRREARRTIWQPPRQDTWAQRTAEALMAEYFPPPLKAIEA